VVEKASIDEAYMLMRLPEPPAAAAAVAAAAAAAAVAAATDPFSSPNHHHHQQQQQALQQQREAAEALAQAIRQATATQLGLTVSVGVAPNKLLAKLASRLAKPDGVHVVAGQQAVQQLLATTPVERLPGGWR
jgi:nucleotidyltransferase/DNA polymerase involved in DNA repair